MEEKVTLGRIEKRHYLGYLILLYVVVTGLLIWLVFSGTSNPFAQLSDVERAAIKRAEVFEDYQREAVKVYDSTLAMIKASYGGAHTGLNGPQIDYGIAYIRGLYTNPTIQDERKIVFAQMADFLSYSFSNAHNIDVQEANIAEYEQALDRCRNGQQ